MRSTGNRKKKKHVENLEIWRKLFDGMRIIKGRPFFGWRIKKKIFLEIKKKRSEIIKTRERNVLKWVRAKRAEAEPNYEWKAGKWNIIWDNEEVKI